MSCPAAKPNVTVALRLARSPPETVTSNTVLAVTVATLVTVAVVPATVKSAAFTFCTFSSNVMRHVRLSALVGEVAGVWRVIDAIARRCGVNGAAKYVASRRRRRPMIDVRRSRQGGGV